MGLLHTTSQFADYVLKVDFRAAEDTNSGIFLRTPLKPADAGTDCYELQIAAEKLSPFPTGSFVKRQKAMAVTPAAAKQPADWRTYEITARGGHFTVQLDSQTVLDFTDPKPLARGRIGLQFNTGPIEFRNVKLKPLGLTRIFNGRDLTGWRELPGRKSVFTVTPEGWLNVKNGNGQLESEAKYGDFVWQLEIFSNGKNLNSGVFFRGIPGQFWFGYESQIHNGYKDGDRSKPVDFGTGGIYNRQPARKVVPNDFEWFAMTIAAAGPHMAVWVNGYPVSDFTDTRPAHANPRQGLRLEPGVLLIQGHDPTTDLSFRNLQIGELPR
jgi:hypothetical protein